MVKSSRQFLKTARMEAVLRWSAFLREESGMMARYIIENKIDSVEALTKFDTAGYYFVEEVNERERVSLRCEEQ